MATYVFDQAWEREKERLDAQAAMYEEGTRRLIASFALPASARCAEIGGGSGTVAAWLCEHVPAGAVVATDLDTRFLDALEHPHLEVRKHNIVEEPLEADAYDLVHARLLLEHLGEARTRALEHMVAALKPGGVLLVEDYDVVTALVERTPPSAPVTRAIEAICKLLEVAGSDPYYGRKLPTALRGAGLVDVHAEGRLTVMESGQDGSMTLILLLEQLRAPLTQSGLLGVDDFEQAMRDASTPGADGYPPLMVAAWGRKPA